MLEIRVIPVLLLKDGGLWKTRAFSEPKYVGDPINAVKIFNEKEVDELLVLDIGASISNKGPDFELIESLASECFMPLGYGGGVRSLQDIQKLFLLGVEKVVLNTAAVGFPDLISQAAAQFGSQSIVVSIDAKKSWLGGYEVRVLSGTRKTKWRPEDFAVEVERLGAGEIIINSIDNDGQQSGYDLELVKRVASVVRVPVIACGGAGVLEDFHRAVRDAGASAVAAGSMFIFHGKHRAVLISYPKRDEIDSIAASCCALI